MGRLDESLIKKVEEINESLDMKSKPITSADMVELFESEGPAIAEKKIPSVIKMLQLQESSLQESNVSANIAPWSKKLQPLLRRIAPALFAHEIAGVQPIDTPTSDIFVIKSKYAGSKNNAIATDAKILVFTGTTAVAVGDTITGANGGVGTVKYVEAGVDANVSKAIVEVTSGSFTEGELFDVGASYTADGNELTINAIYSSETSFKQVLKNYSGPMTTAEGEVAGNDINELKVTVEKMTVTAKTRTLKANFTTELVQDLQAMHGANADQEIMTFLEQEILMDLDREIIDTYKSIATPVADFAVSSDSAGRWSLEMYAGLYQKIVKMSVDIANDTRRGAGNALVATGSVIAALDALGSFRETDYSNSVDVYSAQNTVYRGTLKNGIKVYQDFFNDSGKDYVLVVYKGASAWDAGLIYSPYISLNMVEAIDPETLTPILGLKTRYALTANTALSDNGGSEYCRMMVVDFSATPLA